LREFLELKHLEEKERFTKELIAKKDVGKFVFQKKNTDFLIG